jgi:hypothetical protein
MDYENPYAAPEVTGKQPDQYLTYGYPRRRMRFVKDLVEFTPQSQSVAEQSDAP